MGYGLRVSTESAEDSRGVLEVGLLSSFSGMPRAC